MLLKLKQLYEEQCVIDEIPEYPNDYYWYKDEYNHLVGIKKSIPRSERKLLGMMLEEIVGVDFDQQTKLFWLEFLLHDKKSLYETIKKGYQVIRFTFFTHHFDAEMKIEFDQLMKEFHDQSTVLFLDRQYGVILDLSPGVEYSFKEMAEAIQQDFYQNINFYQTQVYALTEEVSSVFRLEFMLYQKYRDVSQLMIGSHDLLLQYMIQSLNLYEGYEQFHQKFQAIPYDLTEVAKIYMENNFNVSTGAKAIYMHRNTFMNKLERFIQLSGLNIKEFRDALIAYAIIHQMEHEQKVK